MSFQSYQNVDNRHILLTLNKNADKASGERERGMQCVDFFKFLLSKFENALKSYVLESLL